MVSFKTLRELVIGAPLDPLDPRTRHAIAVIPLLAWVGLGADGLSSSCYGPEEAFLALGVHTHLALYLALATALTVFVISVGYNQVIVLCLLIKRHYMDTRRQLAEADALFAGDPAAAEGEPRKIDPEQPTAVVLVSKHRGASMHALLWVQRLFPGHFRNYVFLAVGEVDAQSYEGQEQLHQLQKTIDASLQYYANYCRRHGFAAECRVAYGTDPVTEFTRLAESVMQQYPNSVCFASKLIFRRVDFLTAWLHNQTPVTIQQRLHLEGRHMVLLPMKGA